MDTRFFRVAVYSLLGLCGLTLCAKVSHPLLTEAVFLLFCLLPAILESVKKEVPLFPLLPRRPLSSLLFLPLLLADTIGFSCLTALIFPSLKPGAVAFTPMTMLTSALSPAIGEEMLFRYTCLALLLPYGKRFGVAVSALLFALFHQNFYQMPYALAAGIVLALAALYSRSFLLPIFLHFANNLLSLFMGDRLTTPLVFLFVGLGATAGVALFFLSRKKESSPPPKEPLALLSLLPLLLYAAYCIFMAVLRL